MGFGSMLIGAIGRFRTRLKITKSMITSLGYTSWVRANSQEKPVVTKSTTTTSVASSVPPAPFLLTASITKHRSFSMPKTIAGAILPGLVRSVRVLEIK